MTDILSQDEIDALLKAGLGEGDSDQDGAESSAPSQASARQSTAGAGAGGMSFDSMFGSQPNAAGANLKRSVKIAENKKINVQPAVFPNFDLNEPASDSTELGTILNIDLNIHVELGKTTQTIREVLEMGSGSVMELDKLNGEPVDIVVNTKPFAKGEMIVIGENFGVRVTDILSIHEIIEALR